MSTTTSGMVTIRFADIESVVVTETLSRRGVVTLRSGRTIAVADARTVATEWRSWCDRQPTVLPDDDTSLFGRIFGKGIF